MFAHQETRGRIDVAFTDRHGGVSGGPYASLNLSAATGDDADSVRTNVERVTDAFTGSRRSRPVLMRQVHGADVHVVDDAGQEQEPPTADALVTRLPGLPFMVRVADCIPVLLADAEHGVVAAAHAGRPGLVAGIVPNTVTAMRSLGAQRITGWLGPHVCGRCYEVPARMREEVVAVVPEAYAETSWGTPSLDIGAGVRAQLDGLDVEVQDVARCTIEDDDLYSYRRQGRQSGRLGGLVWVRP